MPLDVDLDQTDPAALLKGLLAQWKRTPDPVLADLIDAVDAQFPRDPVEARTVDQHRALRSSRFRPVTELGIMLETLVRQRVRDLSILIHDVQDQWPDDPRFTTFYRRLIDNPPWTSRASQSIWVAVFNRLAKTRDARVADLVGRDLSPGFPGRTGEYVNGQRAAKVDGRTFEPSALTDDDRATLRARLQDVLRRAAPATDLDAALEAALSDLDDIAARHVYADALLQEGDPRGEWMQLQLLDAPTREQKQRANALLKAHADDWLGPVSRVVLKTGRVFRQGFLHAVILRPKSRAAAQAALNDPNWRAVRDVTLRESTPQQGHRSLELLVHPGMGPLTRVGGLCSPDELEATARRFPALVELGLIRDRDWSDDTRRRWSEEPSGSSPELPHLDRVSLPEEAAPWLDWLRSGGAPLTRVEWI